MIKNFILIFITSLFFSSCASYIDQMYREFDRADGNTPSQQKDKFAMYRKRRRAVSSRPKDVVNSQNNPYVIPSIKRKYRSENERKRYKAEDLTDNRGDGSLWSGVEGRNNYLFTENDEKSHGDIVLIKVAGRMKNEITAELKRAFPAPQQLGGEEKKDGENSKEPASAAPADGAGDDKVDATNGQIYDRISSVVVEEINKDHILLRGRKNVLYKNRKRLVEVQALISRRDVMGDDTVHSDKIIENNIVVLR